MPAHWPDWLRGAEGGMVMAVPNEVYALLREFDKEYGNHWERIPETDERSFSYLSRLSQYDSKHEKGSDELSLPCLITIQT